MPAEYARFKRAAFQAALRKREQQLSNSGCYPLFVLGWVLCTSAVFRLFASAMEGQGGGEQPWWHMLMVPLLFIVVLGPPILLPYWSRRSLRPFLKCPSCKRPTNKHDNQRYILATGKCGWCGSEVLEPGPAYEAAIPPITPSSAFEKISLPDLLANQAKDAPWGRKNRTIFALLYGGGLLAICTLSYGAGAYGKPEMSGVLRSLGFLWVLALPKLLLQMLRQRRLQQSKACPHCKELLNHMLVIVTRRCGSCGVEVVESGDRNPAKTLPHQDSAPSREGPGEDFVKLSRLGFMAQRGTMADARPHDTAAATRLILPYVGSSLVILVISIVVLPPPWLLIVPLGWFLGAGAVSQLFLGRRLRKVLQERSEGTRAKYIHCPACWKSIADLNGSFLVTTGRCGECLSVVLDDDTTRASSPA